MARIIQVVSADPSWHGRYVGESLTIKHLLGRMLVSLYHIGSTSVPNLDAKPTIDVLAWVSNVRLLDSQDIVQAFIESGYRVYGEYGIAGRRYYSKGEEEHTCHLHAFGTESESDLYRHLAFREYMRTFSNEAQVYGQLKRHVAQGGDNDIRKYCDGKYDYVQAIECKAVSWARECGMQLADFAEF